MTESDDTTADSTSILEDVPWRRVANVAALVLLVAIVLPFVVYTVPQVVGAEHSYIVLSGSMEPTMSPGDVIVVNSVPAQNIEKGDVITFGGDGGATPTTHRVINVTQQDGSVAFRTKGDANEDPDGSLVTPDQLQGRVMSVSGYLFVIPYIGWVISFANQQLGSAALVIIPVVLLVLNEVWNLVAATRSEADPDGGTGERQPDASEADADKATVPAGSEPGQGAVAGAVEEGSAETAAGDDESDDAGITFSTAELQLGLVVLAAFLAYSVWVAYKTTEIWAFGVAGGVGAAFLLLGGLYLFGGSVDPGTAESGASGSSSGPAPPEASEAPGADGDDTGPVRAEDVDPETELDLLEDVVGQVDGGDPAAESSEQHLSDGGSTPGDARDSSEAGFEFLAQDDDGVRDRTPDADDDTNEDDRDE